jgi:hypothetical protein
MDKDRRHQGDLEAPAMTEQWKPVPGFDGYEVSDQGRVKSHRRGKPRLLRLSPNSSGYLTLTLYDGNGNGRARGVHQLVLEAFVGPRPEGMYACHGPGGCLDNRLSNLYWDTPANNSGRDMDRDGTRPPRQGELNHQCRLTEQQAQAILNDTRTQEAIAKDYGVSRSLVGQIKRRAAWAHLEEQGSGAGLQAAQ